MRPTQSPGRAHEIKNRYPPANSGLSHPDIYIYHRRSSRCQMFTLHPSQPPLATIGRALTLVQVIFYLPLTLDVGGQDAFLALSAALASYYWGLSSLRLVTRKTRLQWVGDLFAIFQFLVVPACLAVCWAVYCPPEKNYFFVRWARYAGVKTSLTGPVASFSDASEASQSTKLGSPLLNSAAPPHLAAILQAIHPIVRRKETHPYLKTLCKVSSRVFFYFARNVPGWWGTLLRFAGPVFSLLEGSATLLVIQVLGTGCRYIIATSLTQPQLPPSSSQRRNPLFILSSIGLRGAEAWQLGFLLSSAIIYVISGWALYLAFDGVAARGGEAALMMGVSVSSVAWLTAIAFAIGKGNVVETALIFAYISWNIFALSSAASLSFVADPLALVRSFKGQMTSSYLDALAPILSAHTPSVLQSLVPEFLELVKVTFGQSWTFLGALASALPASVVVSLVYRLMVLYAASRILPFLCGPSARRRQVQWPPRHRHPESTSSSRKSKSVGRTASTSSTASSASSNSSASSSSSSSTSSSGCSTSASSLSASNSIGGTSYADSDSDVSSPLGNGASGKGATSSVRVARKHASNGHTIQLSNGNCKNYREQNISRRVSEAEAEPFGSFINFIVSYSRWILIAVYSHLLCEYTEHNVAS